jgi:hypothetical protein
LTPSKLSRRTGDLLFQLSNFLNQRRLAGPVVFLARLELVDLLGNDRARR